MKRVLMVLAGSCLPIALFVGVAAGNTKDGGSGSVACNDGTVTWSPTTLWPPNHKMQTIELNYSDNDGDGDMTSITVGMISDNQTVGGVELNGSGQPTDQQGMDWSGPGNTGMATDPNTAGTTAQVRAERSGHGSRTYTIQVTCIDMGGTSMEMSAQTVNATVTVPHDQRTQTQRDRKRRAN
jgi:hypothetical protein